MLLLTPLLLALALAPSLPVDCCLKTSHFAVTVSVNAYCTIAPYCAVANVISIASAASVTVTFKCFYLLLWLRSLLAMLCQG